MMATTTMMATTATTMPVLAWRLFWDDNERLITRHTPATTIHRVRDVWNGKRSELERCLSFFRQMGSEIRPPVKCVRKKRKIIKAEQIYRYIEKDGRLSGPRKASADGAKLKKLIKRRRGWAFCYNQSPSGGNYRRGSCQVSRTEKEPGLNWFLLLLHKSETIKDGKRFHRRD